MATLRFSVIALTLVTAAACDPGSEQVVGTGDRVKAGDGKADSSVEAVIVDFEWDGELTAPSAFNPRAQIDDQLLYTIGHLSIL